MAVRRQPVKRTQRPVAVHRRHATAQYQRSGFRSAEHARRCSHVRAVVTHHRISDKEAFYSILASGLSIVAALLTIGITLSM